MTIRIDAYEWDYIRTAFQEEVEDALVKTCTRLEQSTKQPSKTLTPGYQSGPEMVRRWFDELLRFLGVEVDIGLERVGDGSN